MIRNSWSKLRRIKKDDYVVKGQKSSQAELISYTAILNKFLIWDITNIRVCLECFQEEGFPGGLIIVKNFIAAHRFLIPTRWQLVAPQGSRDRRFTTESGEAFQMEWGFTNVLDYGGSEYRVACFSMICHRYGQRYVGYFPNAKQENLLIDMIHGFAYMGIP